MNFSNKAQIKALEDSGIKEITIDGKNGACEKCSQHFNKKIKIEDAPSLPVHYNCKCVAVPVIDDGINGTTDTKTVYENDISKRRGTEMGEYQGEGGKKRRRKPRSKYTDTAYKSDKVDEGAELVLKDANKKSIRQNKEY